MKHLRLFLLVVAVMTMQMVSAKPKTQEYTNDMIRIEVPANFTAQEADNAITFTADKEKSELSVFMINYLCMDIINIFEDEQISISLTTAVRTFTKKVEKEYKTFECTEPVRDTEATLPTYYSTYKASTSTGKKVKGFVKATIHNGCMFLGVIQHENAKTFAQWVGHMHTLQPINIAAKETVLNRNKSEESAIVSPVPLTKTYTGHGITFNHPENMLITESEDNGEIQLVCNYVGDHTAIMNLNFTVNPIFALADRTTAEEVCSSAVQEMSGKLTSIYSSATSGDIKSDPNWPHPNKYTEFEGQVFGMNMKGRLEAFLMGSCYVVVVQQAENDEMLRMLRAVKQTIKKAE